MDHERSASSTCSGVGMDRLPRCMAPFVQQRCRTEFGGSGACRCCAATRDRIAPWQAASASSRSLSMAGAGARSAFVRAVQDLGCPRSSQQARALRRLWTVLGMRMARISPSLPCAGEVDGSGYRRAGGRCHGRAAAFAVGALAIEGSWLVPSQPRRRAQQLPRRSTSTSTATAVPCLPRRAGWRGSAALTSYLHHRCIEYGSATTAQLTQIIGAAERVKVRRRLHRQQADALEHVDEDVPPRADIATEVIGAASRRTTTSTRRSRRP